MVVPCWISILSLNGFSGWTGKLSFLAIEVLLVPAVLGPGPLVYLRANKETGNESVTI